MQVILELCDSRTGTANVRPVPTSSKSPHSHGRSEVRTRTDLAPVIKRELQRIGARLRALRQERGLTQEQVAEKMRVHPKYLTRLEGGGVNVTLAGSCVRGLQGAST